MKKSISILDPKTPTKNPVGINANIPDNAWLTWNVIFSKELTLEEISLEQPFIEDFLNEYLADEISEKNKEGSGMFRYIWKQLSKASNIASKASNIASKVSNIPSEVLNMPSQLLERSSRVSKKPSQDFWLYNTEIFINIPITKNLSVPNPPGSILKIAKKYKRGSPGGSSKNTVVLTKPKV